MLILLNKIIHAIENKQFSIGIFLDLSKAFGHKKLLGH